MEPYEWAYWMEGKPAEKDIKAPDGSLLEKTGAARDGGSYDDRMGNVACWNAVMDENDYMVRKWNEFINWYLSGWAGAYLNRQGYYSAVLPTAKAQMEPYEWAYWMEGKPAEKDIKGPDGSLLEKAGATRDGGSYDDRMGNVACWNAVMDENDYMVRKWNEFIAS